MVWALARLANMEKWMINAKVMRVGANVLIRRNPSLQDNPCLKLEVPPIKGR
jgi:hypothetical protein